MSVPARCHPAACDVRAYVRAFVWVHACMDGKTEGGWVGELEGGCFGELEEARKTSARGEVGFTSARGEVGFGREHEGAKTEVEERVLSVSPFGRRYVYVFLCGCMRACPRLHHGLLTLCPAL